MYAGFLKRVFDIILALFFILPVLLLIFIIAMLIKMEDGGRVLYTSMRLGKDGTVFPMFKLRSMKENSPDIRNQDGSTYNEENDFRQTKIGKFLRKSSLDEIPQLFNVLKGDMSFIGPRPDLPEQLLLYQGNEFKKLKVKPGITGYNQAYFRNSIPWKDRIENDIYYVNHLSFCFDAKIFFITIGSVLLGKGIFTSPKCSSYENTNLGG